MTMSYAEPIQRLRHAKTKIVSFSELLSILPSFFFFWLQDLQRVTKETKEHEVSSSLQNPQTSPENCWFCTPNKRLKNHCSDSTDKLWFQMAWEDVDFIKSQNEHGWH